MSYENKWKDKAPAETVKGIKKFLADSNIIVKEEEVTCVGNCYAVVLLIEDTNLFVNGKGSSKEFAMASAYGELMERIMTKVLFRYNYYDRYSEDKEYIFLKDEVRVDRVDYDVKKIYPLGLEQCDYEAALNVQRYFTAYSDKLVLEPFKTLIGNKTRYFPVSVLDVAYGTNGMAFGNTLEEAKTQALSEIFERYCNKRIINEEKVMPKLSLESGIINERVRNEIYELMKKTGLDISVYDASLGEGYPVICVIYQNRHNNTYFVKFGAHFDINIAIERCLTEMFQGRQLEQSKYMKKKIYLEDAVWRKKNMESILHTGDGFYPLKVLEGKNASYKFEPWPEFESNGEALDYYTNKLLQLNEDTFFKIYKIGDFCTVRYLVPGISQIYDDLEYKMRWQSELNTVSDLLERMPNLETNELAYCINFIKNNIKSVEDTLIPFFKHKYSYSSIYRYYNLYILYFEFYMMSNDLQSAKKIIDYYEKLATARKEIILAMKRIVKSIENSNDKTPIYKFALSKKLFDIETLADKNYCQRRKCYCSGIKATYNKMYS
ncbi:MAG: YcaO-like family protein [Lachnospiraceae bacterium]|nr:YcaO-like family protein [Lachnospiraceae bacterium]